VPIQQAIDMAAALARAGVKHRFVHYADRGHMSVTDEVKQHTLDFIAEVEER
jgi:dipeptidyl aminopeptidase/acylaminoacyl peptidase